jgi:hypothetical protein
LAARRSPARNNLAGWEGAEAAFNELVKPYQVEEELHSCIGNQPMSAVAGLTPAGDVDEAEERSDDKNLPVAEHS